MNNNDFNSHTNEDTQEINLDLSNKYKEESIVDQNKVEYDPKIEEAYINSKKENTNRKCSFKISFIAIITMLILACGIVSLYPYIKKAAVKDDTISNPYENYEILEGIHDASYFLYKYTFIKENTTNKYDWDEIYLKPEYEQLDGYRRVRNELYFSLDKIERKLLNDFKNLDYTVIDNEGTVATSKNYDMEKIVSENNEEDLARLQNYYGFYMVVRYDNDGYANVEKIYGADAYEIRNSFSEFNFGYFHRNTEADGKRNYIQVNPIKNATFIYGIPRNLQYMDKIRSIINYEANNLSIDGLIIIVTIILLTILILGLLIPYKIGIRLSLINLLVKMPLELLWITFGILAFVCGVGSFAAVVSTLEDSFEYDLLHGFGINIALNDHSVIIINVLIWVIVTYCILLGGIYLKYIFNYGFIKYIKDKSIIIKLLRLLRRIFKSILNKIHKMYKYLTRIDLNDKSDKFIIKILTVNLVVMIGFCLFWALGIFFAFIYTAIIFYLSRKKFEKLRKNFQAILNLCNQMQNGNLEVTVDEDLGILNPLKDSIQEIQQGFKKAVDEEVKSQRMKTELISNVSHDLKTPLTSIITYVDLLKKENITEEDRKSYIDTLDKKSQRLKFLIEDLFEVSKATTGNIKLNVVDVDIIELLRQVQIELDDKLRNSDLIVKNNFPENKIILQLDSQKTFRIFENLLNNVSKYAMKGSRVYVDLQENYKEVVITIKNMSAEEMNFTSDEIIERFQRGDKSRNTEGSGLGLAIAKSFVEIQGGQFAIEIDGDLFKAIVVLKK